MGKKIFIIMIMTIIARATGFIREIFLSYYYGSSMVTDAFLIALTIPNIIFAFIAAGTTTGYIPMYNKILEKEGVKKADKFTNNLINFMIFLSTIIVVIILVFTEPIIKIFAMGFKDEALRITILYTRILIFGIYFTGIATVYTGFLQIKNSFIAPQLIALPSNFIWIIAIYFASKYNSNLLPWGGLLALIAQMLFLFPWVKKNNFNYKFNLNLNDSYLKKLIFTSIPIILGVSVNQINQLVDKNIASTFNSGGITALNYASKINAFTTGIFVTSVSVVFYPKISKMVVKNDGRGIVKSLKESIIIINILILPITIGSMIFSNEIVNILFGRGAFDKDAIEITGTVLFYYSIGLFGFGLREILEKVFYAYQDTKTPMINGAIGMILNIILNIVLSKYMGLSGLAFATSISAIITTVMMGITLKKKIGSFGIKELLETTLKIIVSSLLMGVIAKLFFNFAILRFSENISLIFSIGIGVVVYIGIIVIMKIEDVDIILKLLKEKFKKNKLNK